MKVFALLLVIFSVIYFYNTIRSFKFDIATSGHEVSIVKTGNGSKPNIVMVDNTMKANVSGNVSTKVSIANKMAFHLTLSLALTIASISWAFSLFR